MSQGDGSSEPRVTHAAFGRRTIHAMGWIRRGILGAGVVAATSAAGLLCGPVATADEITFLEYLAQHHYTGHYRDGRPVDQGRTILFGVMACNNLRNGMSVQEQLPRFWVMPEFPTIADAAQHELCPDTLG